MFNFILEEKYFHSAAVIDEIVPEDPGYYCFRIKNINDLPESFALELRNRKHNILYIGLASKSLNKRMLKQELRARGHGTFFRSIGAVLGFRPERGSLLFKKNKRNYKFNKDIENQIIQWINDNLIVRWKTVDSIKENEETKLIQNFKPLLNIAKNPLALSLLSDLRRECVEIANE